MMIFHAILICALLSTGQPAKLADNPRPFFTVETAAARLIVPSGKTVEFDAPATATVTFYGTTDTLPIATRFVNVNMLDSSQSVHWAKDGIVEYPQWSFVWGAHIFEASYPSADDAQTYWIGFNVAPPEVRASPVSEIVVAERDNGLIDVRALSTKGNLQLFVDGKLQPISPANKSTVETSAPYQWWEIYATEIPTIRVVAPDGAYTEIIYLRKKPGWKPPPVGTATPTATPTPGPTPTPEPTPTPTPMEDHENRIVNLEFRMQKIEAMVKEGQGQ